ncbi:MAG: adaptor protein MecA [Candidatus Weimeria sp.]
MEIRQLDKDTMECSLTSEEVKKRGISLDEVTYSSPVMRKLIHELAALLAKKHMFGSSSSPSVASEIIPLEDGGLILIFSMADHSRDTDPHYSVFASADDSDSSEDLTESDDAPSDPIAVFRSILEEDMSRAEEEKYLYHYESENDSVRYDMAVFEFPTLDKALCALLRIVGDDKILVKIYRSPAGVYLAVLHFYNYEKGMIDDIISILMELGMRREVNSCSELYIEEHCEVAMPGVSLFLLKFIFQHLK